MSIIDKLASLRAEIQKLKEEEAKIVDHLKSRGAGVYEGQLHYAVVSEVTRKTLNMKAVRAKLSRQFIQANTNESTSIQLRLMGYSKKDVA
tara:strand:+ start:1356 stop:1628 length:273 start_codon:yes stop_codon:yes gene_type:complete